MRKTTYGAVLLAFLIPACGGEGDAVPPPQPPPPPPPMATQPPAPAPTPAAPEAPKPALLDLEKQAQQAATGAINAHDAKKFAEIYTPDAKLIVTGIGEFNGREGIQGEIQKVFDSFPDFKVAITKTYAKGDVIVQEWVITGTNKGEFNGMKPTNKPFGLRGVGVLHFTPDGLVKEEHRYFDGSTTVAQLGQSKMPARPVASLPSGEPEWHVAKGTADEDKQADAFKKMASAFDTKSEGDFVGAMADSITWSDLAQPKDMSGKDSAKKFFGMWTKAFTDIKSTYDTVISVDEYVVSENTLNAVHSGQLGPLKPTKKPITLHGVDVAVFKDGKIASGTSYSNSMELLGQEGLLPKPKAAKAEGDKKAGDKKAEGDKKASDKDKPKADAKTGGDKDKDKK